MMDVFEVQHWLFPKISIFQAMQNNARVKAYAQKLQEDEQKYPLSSAKSLWEMVERLQVIGWLIEYFN